MSSQQLTNSPQGLSPYYYNQPISYCKKFKSYTKDLFKDLELDITTKDPLTGRTYLELIQMLDTEKKGGLYILALIEDLQGIHFADGHCTFEATVISKDLGLLPEGIKRIHYFAILNSSHNRFCYFSTLDPKSAVSPHANGLFTHCRTKATTQIILGLFYENKGFKDKALEYFMEASCQGSVEGKAELKRFLM